jgi:hypothetical protein
LVAGSSRPRLGGLMATLPNNGPAGSVTETENICNIL